MRKIDIQAVVWKEGKQYVSQCLNFEIASYGKTEAIALRNLREAVELYLEGRKVIKAPKVGKANVVSMKLSYA